MQLCLHVMPAHLGFVAVQHDCQHCQLDIRLALHTLAELHVLTWYAQSLVPSKRIRSVVVRVPDEAARA